LKTIKFFLLVLLVNNSFAYVNPLRPILEMPEKSTRMYSDYKEVLGSDELEFKMGESAFKAIDLYQMKNDELNIIKNDLLLIIKEAQKKNKVTSSVLSTLNDVYYLVNSKIRFKRLEKQEKEDVFFIINLAFYTVDFLNSDHEDYYRSHDLLYVDIIAAIRELYQSIPLIKELKTFSLHPAIKAMTNGSKDEVEKLKFSNLCKYKNMFDYYSKYLKIKKPVIKKPSNISTSAPVFDFRAYSNMYNITGLSLDEIQRNFESSRAFYNIRTNKAPMKLVNMPVSVQGCEHKAYIYLKKVYRLDHEELERLTRSTSRIRYPWEPQDDNPFNPLSPTGPNNPFPNNPGTIPGINPGSIPNIDPGRIPRIDPRINPNLNPRIQPSFNKSGRTINSSRDRSFYELYIEEYMGKIAVQESLKARSTYAYNFGSVVEKKFKLKENFKTTKVFNQKQYNTLLRFLIAALNTRYNENLSTDSVFVDEVTIKNAFQEIDYSLNEDRPVDLTEYCMKEDINDCDGKILRPDIYVLNNDTKIKLNTLHFHPLSIVKSFGKNVELEANTLISPWFDTSGRKLVQTDEGQIPDPGTVSKQQNAHHKSDNRDCDWNNLGIRVNCKTYHYYRFYITSGKQPNKRAKKQVAENGGDITFKIHQNVIGNPLIVANGGLGDNGYTGTPSPNCKKESGKWIFKRHYLRSTGWIFVGGSRDYDRAVRNSTNNTDASVSQGISGDGADGGRGGNITFSVPSNVKTSLVYSVDGGLGGEAGEPQRCGPIQDKNFHYITGKKGNSGKKGVISE
jgi:hypothetical protein